MSLHKHIHIHIHVLEIFWKVFETDINCTYECTNVCVCIYIFRSSFAYPIRRKFYTKDVGFCCCVGTQYKNNNNDRKKIKEERITKKNIFRKTSKWGRRLRWDDVRWLAWDGSCVDEKLKKYSYSFVRFLKNECILKSNEESSMAKQSSGPVHSNVWKFVRMY